MSDTVILEGYNPLSWIWIPIVSIVAVVILAFVIDKKLNLHHELAAPVVTLSVALGGVFGILYPAVWASENWDRAQRISAISDLGYENIQVSDDKFTASDDGIYKSGAFVQVQGEEWLILEAK